MKGRYLVLLAVCIAPWSVQGQQDEPVEGDIVIEADAESARIDHTRTGASTTINVSNNRSDSVADVMEREASVRVNRYGGRGSYSTLSIRGSNPNQVNIYIDGIPLTNAVSGEVNLSDISLQSLERIEIYRSGEYPGSAVGGSVNLVTNQARGEPTAIELYALGGSYKTFGMGAGIRGGDALLYNVSASGETADNDYKFQNDNGTPLINRQDDFDDIRKNAQYKNYFGTLNLAYHYKDTRFSFLNDSAYRRHGVPGAIPTQSEKTERRLFRNTSGLGVDAKGLIWERLRLKSRLYYTELREKFLDPLQEFSSSQPNSRSRLQQYGAHIEPIVYWLEAYQTLRFFLGAEGETYHSDRRDRYDQQIQRVPTRFRDHYTARVEDEFSFVRDRLIIVPAAEYHWYNDRFNDPETNRFNEDLFEPSKSKVDYPGFRLGVRGVYYRDSKLDLYVRVGGSTGRRMPLFLELFGERGRIIGNSDLLPERSQTVEGGPGAIFEYDWISGEISINAFRRFIQDMILFVPNSQFTLRPQNIDRAEINGGEFAANLDAFSHVRLHGAYTYQEAINQSEIESLRGKYLPLRPLHEGTLGLIFYTDRLEIGADATYVGAVYRDRTNEPTSYVGPRWIYGAEVSYAFIKKEKTEDQAAEELLLSLEVKNILNERVTDIVGFPLPGRSAYATLSYTF